MVFFVFTHDRYAAETTESIHLDFQCGEEGSFYVTFIPRRAGMHNLAIKWQNHHVEGSPFRIKVGILYVPEQHHDFR